MNRITLGDPGAGTTQFYLLMPDKAGGKILIMNESAYGLDFIIAGTPFRVPADSQRTINLTGQVNTPVTWSIANSTNASVAPVSDVIVECYACDEPINDNIQPLMRQTNIGNSSLPVTSSASLIADGLAPGTLVIEATPQGAAGSQLKATNDGDFTCGGGLFHISNAGIVTAIPAGAIPQTAIGAGYPASSLGGGQVPAGVTVPAAQIGAGTLPSNVTATVANSIGNFVFALDNGLAQMHSGVNLRGIGLGYNDAGSVYHQVLAVDSTGKTSAVGAVGWSAGASGADTAGPRVDWDNTGRRVEYWAPQSGAAAGHEFVTWDGTTQHVPLGIGVAASAAPSYFADNGDLYTRRITPAYGGSLAGVNHLSGSASATVNHGLGTTPDAAVVNANNGSNSTTFGSGTYTATTVFIYVFSAMAWVGVVYAH